MKQIIAIAAILIMSPALAMAQKTEPTVNSEGYAFAGLSAAALLAATTTIGYYGGGTPTGGKS
jgi:hypothetical protein